MIVELCGNPGCGKTTVAKALKERLLSEGYTVINIHDRQPLKSIRDYITHYAHSAAYRTYGKTKPVKRALREYIRHNRCDGARIWTNCILENIYSADKHRSRYDIVMMDEGVIQFLSSMAHTYDITDDIRMVMRILNKIHYGRDAAVFHCSVDMDTNVDRIVNRNRSGDRFLLDTRREITDQLLIKQRNIDKICSYLRKSQVFSIDITDKDQAVERITGHLELP